MCMARANVLVAMSLTRPADWRATCEVPLKCRKGELVLLSGFRRCGSSGLWGWGAKERHAAANGGMPRTASRQAGTPRTCFRVDTVPEGEQMDWVQELGSTKL